MYLANRFIQVEFDNVQIAKTYALDTTAGQGGVISMNDAD